MINSETDQSIIQITNNLNNELSKLQNLTSTMKFTKADQQQQKKNWEQLKEQRKKCSQNSQERRDDTSRKILVGAIYLKRMYEDPQKFAPIFELLEKTLIRDRDRKLFGFEPLSSDQKILRKSNNGMGI